MKNKVWYYLGQGMASFGIQDTWIEEEKMHQSRMRYWPGLML